MSSRKGKQNTLLTVCCFLFGNRESRAKGFPWQSRTGVLVSGLLLCLVIRAYSPEHKRFDKDSPEFTDLERSSEQPRENKICFLSHQVSERFFRRKWWQVLFRLHQNRGRSHELQLQHEGFGLDMRKVFQTEECSALKYIAERGCWNIAEEWMCLAFYVWWGIEPSDSRNPLACQGVITMFCFVLKFLVVRLLSLHLSFRSTPTESPYLEGEHSFSFPLHQFRSHQALSNLYLGNASQGHLFLSYHGTEPQVPHAKQWPLKGCLIKLCFSCPFFLIEFIQLHVCFRHSGQSSSTWGWCQQTQEVFRAKKTSDLGGSSYGAQWLKFSVSTGCERGRVPAQECTESMRSEEAASLP